MIPAPRGLVARYKHSNPDHHTSLSIVGFDGEGHALVVDDRTGQLIRADKFRNFDGIGDDPYSEIVAIAPASGWRIAWKNDDGTEWSQPLAGWGVKANGCVVPLDTDSTGYVDDLSTSDSAHYRIYHPDAAALRPVDGEATR